jgi:hypothetical protein
VAIARREVQARVRLLIFAALVGLLPLLLPLLVELPRSTQGIGRVPVAAGLLGLLTLVLAPLLGVSVLSADVASRRLGFYLARPLGIPALVAGKVMGGLAVLLAVQLLVAGPAASLEWGALVPVTSQRGLRIAVLGFALGSVFLFALGLVGGLLVRLRSWTMLVAAAALVLWGLLVAAGVHRWGFWITLHTRAGWQESLAAAQAGQAAWLRLVAVLAAGVAVLSLVWLAAPMLAISRGRTDGARVHRWLSLVAWPAWLAITGLLVVLPDGLSRRRLEDPPATVVGVGGGWIALGSYFEPPLFLHSGTGHLRAAPWELWQAHRLSNVVFAASAPRAVWLRKRANGLGEPDRQWRGALEVVSVDLDSGTQVVVSLQAGGWLHGLQVSADGQRAVVLEEGQQGRVLVVDLVAGKELFRARPSPEGRPAILQDARFESATVVHLFQAIRTAEPDRRQDVEIHALDLTRAAFAPVAVLTASGALQWRQGNAGGNHLLWGASAVSVHDGRSGALLASYPLVPGDRHDFLLLADHSLATVRWRAGQVSVLRGQGGIWGQPVDLGAQGKLDTLAHLAMAPIEIGPGKVHVTWGDRPPAPRAPVMRALVDLQAGRMLPLPADLSLVAGQRQVRHTPLDGEAAGLVARLALDGQGRSLFLYDHGTNQRRHLMGAAAAGPVISRR